MSRAFIIAARRSAVVPRGGAFAGLQIHDLAAPVIAAVLADAGMAPRGVGELILANALGAGGNPARLAALAAGLPEGVAGLTVDRQCVGGLDAILLAADMVRAGRHSAVIAGGAESYSRRPLRLRTAADGGAPQPYDRPPFSPFPDRDPEMDAAADALARQLGISRAAQDDWAIQSHARALAAQVATAPEILPIAGQSLDPFARALTPALTARAKVLAGSITTANTAVAADAAAFVLVVSEAQARASRLPAVEITGGVTLGADPALPGLAPVPAIAATLAAAGVTPAHLSTAEIMEAFAVQAIACQLGAGIDAAITNTQGGALARGHPISASGAILAVRLYHQLRGTGGLGLAAIAAAGGLGTAALLKG